MKPVIQEEPTGCAIAAAATVAGVSYAQAKEAANRLGIHAGDSTLWSETGPVRRLLEHFGIRTDLGETPFSTWDALPDRALLAIKWHLEGGKPFWHWVVFVRDDTGEYVLDSKAALKNNLRRDFGRIKPKWFVAVE